MIGMESKPSLQRKSTVAKENGGEFSHQMWTDLYRPSTLPDLVGNEGVVDQLYEWLKDWDDVHIRGNKKQATFRKGINWKDMPNINANAALLSGPPGIGKTSAARIVC